MTIHEAHVLLYALGVGDRVLLADAEGGTAAAAVTKGWHHPDGHGAIGDCGISTNHPAAPYITAGDLAAGRLTVTPAK